MKSEDTEVLRRLRARPNEIKARSRISIYQSLAAGPVLTHTQKTKSLEAVSAVAIPTSQMLYI